MMIPKSINVNRSWLLYRHVLGALLVAIGVLMGLYVSLIQAQWLELTHLRVANDQAWQAFIASKSQTDDDLLKFKEASAKETSLPTLLAILSLSPVTFDLHQSRHAHSLGYDYEARATITEQQWHDFLFWLSQAQPPFEFKTFVLEQKQSGLLVTLQLQPQSQGKLPSRMTPYHDDLPWLFCQPDFLTKAHHSVFSIQQMTWRGMSIVGETIYAYLALPNQQVMEVSVGDQLGSEQARVINITNDHVILQFADQTTYQI